MKWFKEKEFACKCCGQLPPEARENVRALVSEVLDPVRERFGMPIRVNSGYRCPKHNTAVGGVKNSQHLIGEAADVTVMNENGAVAGSDYDYRHENLRMASLILKDMKFDQMILENVKPGDLRPQWIHVSYKRKGRNRHEVLKKAIGRKGYQPLTLMELMRVRDWKLKRAGGN